jgi:drug/metabolite transporter (DMT)-like permease
LSAFVIFIIFCSTIMHASWNILARYDRSEGEFYHKMLITMILVGLLPAVWSEIHVRSLTPLAWACVAGSGTCAGLYLFFLARAFESSDFTIVYPVARSLPVIFVAVGDVLRGRFLTPVGWIGIFMVASGCILVPLRSYKDFSLQKYFNRSSLWMVLAALGTVGYTLLDKTAAEVVQQGPDTAARYGYIYFSISFIPYTLLLRSFKTGKPHPEPQTGAKGWKFAIPAAFLSFGAYWLVLWAYQLSPYASYIVAFRQFSIVIGAVMAFLIYKEQGRAVRLTGALLITIGLILIAIWGR